MKKAPLTILIADDDEGDRMQLKRTLKKTQLTCDIIEATSMDDALASVSKNAVDCAIIDFNMPGSDVLQGIETLRQDFPYTSVIMVTGQGDEVVATDAFKSGVDDYIPKRAITASAMERIIMATVDKSLLQKKYDEQREAMRNYTRILAHDLSAPARQVLGFVDLIETHIQQENYENLDEYFGHLKNAATHINDLVMTLGEYNKIDGHDVIFEPVSMKAVFDKTLLNMGAFLEGKNAHITHDAALPEVVGNRPQLMQLMQNLISNAIKYNTAETPTVHIASEQVDGAWQFSVKDNGIGIPKDSRKKIFDMFQRLPTRGVLAEGSGIGLAICKKVVERHGGEIWCDSKEGQGTTFHFTIADDIA